MTTHDMSSFHYNFNHSVSKSFGNFYIREKMKTIHVWFTICYSFVSVNAIMSQKALIFDRKEVSLIVPPTKDSPQVNYNTWVAACPAKDEDQVQFETKYSFRNAALFVNDFQSYKCAKPYQLSMAWFQDAIEFGYEIYVRESKALKLGFTISPYNDYEPLKYFLYLNTLSWRELFNYLKKIYYERKQNEADVKLELKHQPMEFIWIPLFKVWFKSNRFRKIEYQIHKNNVNAKLSCKDYSLGNELFYGADVDSLYSVENQEKVLRNSYLPASTEVNGCDPEYECFSKWLLLPADQFQFNSSSPILCSDIATVPIWTSTIKSILQKLDDYLYILSRVSGEPLRIVAGASEIVELPHPIMGKWLFSSYVYFRHEKFKIPAPNVIYKIVKFKINQCEIGPDLICWYGVIILIHNDPFFDGKNLICEDLTEELGWSEIKYEKLSSEEGQKPSKYIYVCAINRKSIEGVGLTYNWDLLVSRLSLVEFPDRGSKKFATKNVKDKVFEELKRLSEGGKVNLNENEVIERPPIDDEDFDLNFTISNDDEDQELNSESYDNSESKGESKKNA